MRLQKDVGDTPAQRCNLQIWKQEIMYGRRAMFLELRYR